MLPPWQGWSEDRQLWSRNQAGTGGCVNTCVCRVQGPGQPHPGCCQREKVTGLFPQSTMNHELPAAGTCLGPQSWPVARQGLNTASCHYSALCLYSGAPKRATPWTSSCIPAVAATHNPPNSAPSSLHLPHKCKISSDERLPIPGGTTARKHLGVHLGTVA